MRTHHLFLLFASLVSLVACAGPRAQTVISLQNISCQSCGTESIALLKKTEGVYEAAFDKDKAELAVSYNPKTQTPGGLAKAISGLGYKAAVGRGLGSYGAETSFSEGADVQVLTNTGATLEIAEHLVPNKVTVFDFFATWCGPCKTVDQAMSQILSEAPDVAYRKINIVDWKSEVAQRYLGKVPELPYVVIFGKDGQEITRIAGLDLVRLRAVIGKARTP